MARGRWLNPATERRPVTVLGALAAQRLGIDRVYPGQRIWLKNQWFYVAGTLKPATLSVDIDTSALIGYPAAERYLGYATAAKDTFNSLFLGLGLVALIVGSVGVADIMVISVLERRSEIGPRRALGATRGQTRTQFLAEAVMLALLGGVAGVVAGSPTEALRALCDHGGAVTYPR